MLVSAEVGYSLFHQNVPFSPKLSGWLPWLGVAVLLLSVGYFVYRFLAIRSLILYTNDQGVWVYKGIFPWSKGVSGIKWDVFDDAIFSWTFFSWISKSYTVRIGHRVSAKREIVLPHIHRGNEAVEYINELHLKAVSGLVTVTNAQKILSDAQPLPHAHVPHTAERSLAPKITLQRTAVSGNQDNDNFQVKNEQKLDEGTEVNQAPNMETTGKSSRNTKQCQKCKSVFPGHYLQCLKCGDAL